MSDATKIRLLGWLHALIGGAGVGAGALLLAILLFSLDQYSGVAGFVVPIVVMLSCAFFLPALAGGIGLLHGRRWARPLLIALSILELFVIPVGTVIGLIGLWVLLSPGVAATLRAKHAAATPAGATSPWSAPGAGGSVALRALATPEQRRVLVAMAGVAAGFVVVIGTGFLISGRPMPAELRPLYVPAILVLGATLVLGLRAIVLGRVPWREVSPYEAPRVGFLRAARLRRDFDAQRRERLARLAADPRRRPYVALIEKGEEWSDAQIDYDLDRMATATCAHLQPIERAIRAAGIRARRWAGPDVSVDCTLDPAAIKRRFAPPVCVRYEEPPPYDRASADSPVGLLRCVACQSRIVAWAASGAAPDSAFPGS